MRTNKPWNQILRETLNKEMVDCFQSNNLVGGFDLKEPSKEEVEILLEELDELASNFKAKD